MARLVVDPITRIEGHLRIEAEIAGGKVADAWSAGTMFRGVELILKGRDPREAWMFAQRVCGVCTTVHSIASCRAVENALGIVIPENARILRNIMEAALYVQDHVVHFYHLHALDWVDIVSALSGDPAKAGSLQRSMSGWYNNTAEYFAAVKVRLQKFVSSGQLGLFANGYWGHPAYKLPPEANLVLAAHYLEALNFQRTFITLHAMLGGKNPHPQTYAVGGMAIPLERTAKPDTVNPTTIASMKALARQAMEFITKVYVPDVMLVAKHYKDWAERGEGVGNFLSFGDFPTNTSGHADSYWLPRGIVVGRALNTPPQTMSHKLIKEFIARSWYTQSVGDSAGLHPGRGQTTPSYTGPKPPYNELNVGGKYSWLKTPRYEGLPMEVGPLARMVVAYAAGHKRVRQLVDATLSKLGLPAKALFSTLGRVAARAIETQVVGEQLSVMLDQLLANVNAGNLTVCNNTLWNPSTWPATANGWGPTEAPRGALGHWVSIANGKIDNYQMIVATAWNGSPRDAAGVRGPFEQSLIGTPVVDSSRPLEILRTIHSFDPCMACAVHVVDAARRPMVRIENTLMRT